MQHQKENKICLGTDWRKADSLGADISGTDIPTEAGADSSGSTASGTDSSGSTAAETDSSGSTTAETDRKPDLVVADSGLLRAISREERPARDLQLEAIDLRIREYFTAAGIVNIERRGQIEKKNIQGNIITEKAQ